MPPKKTSSQRCGTQGHGNPWTAKQDGEMTTQAMRKMLYGKLDKAIKKVPQMVQEKFREVQNLKGKRGGCHFHHKREFLMQWVEDPELRVPTDINLSICCLYKALPV